MTDHIISIGGGLASTWKLPELVIAKHGRDNVQLIMARLPNEDPDVWRLCNAVENHLGIPIQYIGLDQDPWQIFFRERMMGSSRIDPCSKILKRQVIDRWIRDHCDPATTIRYIGFTAEEAHRMVDYRAIMNTKGWTVEAPLMDDPTITRESLMAECQTLFGFIPRLYRWGFHHNNCGGACVKAGQKEWARLLRYLPDVYHWWETNEQAFQRQIGTTATILRDRRGGTTKPLSLRDFRLHLQQQWQAELDDPLAGLEETPPCAFCVAG